MIRRAFGLFSPRLSLASLVLSCMASLFVQQYAGPALLPRDRHKTAIFPEGWGQPNTKKLSSRIENTRNSLNHGGRIHSEFPSPCVNYHM